MGKMKIGKSPRKDGLSRKVHVSGSPVQVTRFPRKKKPVYTRKFNNKESKKRSKCEGCECYTFIEKIEVEKYAQEVYGPKVDYSDTYLHCPSCGHDKQSTANSSGKAKAKAKSDIYSKLS